jgi:hypothetical protein
MKEQQVTVSWVDPHYKLKILKLSVIRYEGDSGECGCLKVLPCPREGAVRDYAQTISMINRNNQCT